ncbi:MAG: hypothetical protein HC827_18020 [Cyanobacteria bacterium RM1_2_2]|nr:hypothetical protein [Cyanobacteria bacterium RM1_2_2]
MNRSCLILLHNILFIGAFLPLCLVSLPIQLSSTEPTLSNSSQFLGFGSGIPELRSGGGTR